MSGDNTSDSTAASDAAAAHLIQHGRIDQVDLQLEMQRSYLDYAMSVIVGRALPDVRDGLKPVHRRVIYAMYDGGYRPDKAFSKCARVVGDVMGQFHPHGDSSIYDALVRLVQPWSLRYPLALGQGNFGSPGNDGAAAPRYTETKMAPLALEMVRDIDEDTVDFQDNYDGRTLEPTVLPARFPNLLVNGSVGIAVGMATNIPPHNLREVASGALWLLENPDASREELLEALIQRIKGPDFPTGAQILGTKGIQDAYRTGRGSITMRAVVSIEELQGRTCLVITELPYQVNPDNLAIKIADLVKDAKVTGIADIRDETSGRTGQRLVIVLKRDAVAKVVLNNLYKHTQLQDNFGANMLAIVDGIPRTLPLDGFISHWVTHQIEVIVRRTQFRLNKAEADAHILRGYLKALDALDDVIALIRRSPTVDDAREGLMALLEVDKLQADAILAMQLRRLAALERQKIIDQAAELERQIAEFKSILPARSASARSSEKNSPRSPTSSVTTVAPRSCSVLTATCRLKISSPKRRWWSRLPAVATSSARAATTIATSTAAARASRVPSCVLTTSWSTSSSRRRTIGYCSSRTPVGSTAPRPTRCRRPAAMRRASTLPTCSRCSPAKRSPRSSTSVTMQSLNI